MPGTLGCTSIWEVVDGGVDQRKPSPRQALALLWTLQWQEDVVAVESKVVDVNRRGCGCGRRRPVVVLATLTLLRDCEVGPE